jgi:hypothetical protein
MLPQSHGLGKAVIDCEQCLGLSALLCGQRA